MPTGLLINLSMFIYGDVMKKINFALSVMIVFISFQINAWDEINSEVCHWQHMDKLGARIEKLTVGPVEAKIAHRVIRYEVPEGRVLDESFHQTREYVFAGGESNPVMNAADVPAGLYIEGFGYKSWAIFKPEKIILSQNPERIAYDIKVYCHSGNTVIGPINSCGTGAVVCAKFLN